MLRSTMLATQWERPPTWQWTRWTQPGETKYDFLKCVYTCIYVFVHVGACSTYCVLCTRRAAHLWTKDHADIIKERQFLVNPKGGARCSSGSNCFRRSHAKSHQGWTYSTFDDNGNFGDGDVHTHSSIRFGFKHLEDWFWINRCSADRPLLWPGAVGGGPHGDGRVPTKQLADGPHRWLCLWSENELDDY